MTGYLLDTNVISAFAPGKPAVPSASSQWFLRQSDRLFLSVISVMEIIAGIQKLRRTRPASRADALTAWFEAIIAGYGERIIVLDAEIAREAGLLSDRASTLGHVPGLADIAIAATAAARGMVVLTGNGRHFQPLGIPILDPFTDPLP